MVSIIQRILLGCLSLLKNIINGCVSLFKYILMGRNPLFKLVLVIVIFSIGISLFVSMLRCSADAVSPQVSDDSFKMDSVVNDLPVSVTEAAASQQADESSDRSVAGSVPRLDIQPLKTSLETRLSGLSGDWSIYVKDLDSGAVLEINSHRMKAASLTKLFILITVYQWEEDGKLLVDPEADERIQQMITVSHNESSNELVTMIGNGDFKLGMRRENDFISSLGYNDTEQQRDMKDWRDAPVEGENYSSVRDCGELLESIYNKDCVSAQADTHMLELLLAQTRRGKIPAGVPEGVPVANKTGELNDTENDAAIVFAPSGDYIICVMASDLPDTELARLEIASISSEVFEYLATVVRV